MPDPAHLTTEPSENIPQSAIRNPQSARRVALNALNPFAAQLVTKLLMLGYLVAQYRIVGGGANGPLGDYFLAGFVFLYTSTIAEWGMTTLLTREAAKEGSNISALFARTLALRLILSLLLFLPVVLYLALYVNLFNLSSQGAWATIIITLSLIPQALSGSVSALLYAQERMTLPAAIGVGTALLNIALGLGALVLGWGVTGLAVAATLSTLVTALIFWRILRRDFPTLGGLNMTMLGASRDEWKPLLILGWPLMLNALLVNLFFRADTFVIRASSADGLPLERYNAAYSFLGFVLLITPAVTLALFPRMSRQAEGDRPRLLFEYRFALKLMLIIAAPIVALTVWFAPLLITILTGGKEGYLPDSAVALQILIFFLPLSFVNGVTQYVLIALDRQRLLTGAFVAVVLFNIAANLVLVPLMGINGAALATVASEGVLLLPFLLWTSRELGALRLWELGWKPLLAGLGVGLGMWLLWPLFVNWKETWSAFFFYLSAGLLAAVAYGGILSLLRPLSADETRVLRSAWRRG